ncbi:50S ribosomal protein L4 [Desulfonema ishimotonii]|uniref:Large ribosomal subunit protein uL4 n=1 Tax=Desulfonema ishimotonii TaxID=45657 RepID=A0A401G0E3_9BACT|nr:50S ribosomal protein L4 [Desulfonema ishimotonii]GBC62666.1 50S ribosomal protein L4 [Desulfonema ishimotonii]
MAVVDVFNTNGETVSQMELPDEIFNVSVKPSVLHAVVTMQLASRRSGTASVKRRGDVKGSTRKLFRQKGTGRARRGDIKSPLLRGGGVAFGPSPRSYAYKVPKKVRRLALKMALSSKLQENELVVLDRMELEGIKTKAFARVMDTLDRRNTLLIIGEKDEKIELSSRNLPDIKVLRSEGLNVYDILKYKNIVLLEPAVKAIEGRLSA